MRTTHCGIRLEVDGISLSWVLPEGPSLHPCEGRLAIRSAAYPLDCAAFEGVSERSEMGNGMVHVWDRGGLLPVGDVGRNLSAGRLDFTLAGRLMRGPWSLECVSGNPDFWVLVKRRDTIVPARAGTVLDGPGRRS